jgi:hypothetical protein
MTIAFRGGYFEQADCGFCEVYIGLFVGREYWVGIVLRMSVLGWRSRSTECKDTKCNAIEAISLDTTVNHANFSIARQSMSLMILSRTYW